MACRSARVDPCPDGSTLVAAPQGNAVLSECLDGSGERHGPRRRTLDGVLLWQDQWQHGLQTGRRDLYQGELRVRETSFVGGLRSGPSRGRHPNGSLMFEGAFDAGLATGSWAFYSAHDPIPVAQVTFDGGEPVAAGTRDLVSLEVLSIAVERGEPQVELGVTTLGVGGRVIKGTLPGCDSAGGWTRAELKVWTERDRLVAARYCTADACTGWGLQTVFASAGELAPKGCAISESPSKRSP